MIDSLRIGLVAPAPVPAVVGGAERLWRSLAADLVARGHVAEVLALPTPETTLAEVLAGYQRFLDLDVSRFDLVVTGKYPAWMVTHPRHVRYLLHPLRGLYDTYPSSMGDLADTTQGKDLLTRLDAAGPDPGSLIAAGLALVGELGDDPIAGHPGPLGRELVHRLDAWATAPGRIALHAAISEEVAARPGYVPEGEPVAVVHPASDLPVAVGAEPVDAFVTASRLDRSKRIDLVISAFGQVRHPDARLIVCGDGPERAALEMRAARDSRVSFAGFVDEDELARLYASAVAVPFVPDREDFGYVSLEAMRGGTPVITTTDSGGAKELVVHGSNGLVVEPTPAALGRAMGQLWTDRSLAWHLGADARRRAAQVSWTPLVRLLEAVVDDRPRPRAVALATFSIDPAVGGGQRRLRHLLRGLSERADTTALCLVEGIGADAVRRRILEPGLVQVEVGRSAAHRKADAQMTRVAGMPVDDIGCTELSPATPGWARELEAAVVGADAIVASHPFLTSSVPTGLPAALVYESQDAEHQLKARLLPDTSGGRWLLARAESAEQVTIERAALVTATTDEDLHMLQDFIGAPAAAARTWVVAPNGVDTAAMSCRSAEDHERARREVLVRASLSPEDPRTLVVFVGSWHPPNIEAATLLLELARRHADMVVILAGSHTNDFVDPPPNVRLLGTFPESFLWSLMAAADIAVNPMTSGSGSNLKLLDYLSVGVPVVTTPTGARGIPDPTSVAVVVEPELDALRAGVEAVLAEPEATARRVEAGRRLVEASYDWTLIARAWTDHVLAAAGRPEAPARLLTPTGSPATPLGDPPGSLSDSLTAVIRAIRDHAVADRSSLRELPMDDQLQRAVGWARQHRNVGQVIPPDARLQVLKKAIVRVGRVLSDDQREFNAGVLDAIEALDVQDHATRERVEGLEGFTGRELAGVRQEVGDLRELLATLREDVDRLLRARTRLEGEVQALRHDHRSVLDQAREAVTAASPAAATAAVEALANSSTAPTQDDLYQDFEDEYRGSPEAVSEMLSEHLPLVEHLAGGTAPVLDVGCGRGEWLALCAEAGIPAYGIDTNPAAVARAEERGLDVRVGDAVAHLWEVEPGSLGAVTGFHLVEHLPFDAVIELTDAAQRALVPGGVLLYETPNCQNLQVGANHFWLDPTHLRPVHPSTLAFLLTHRGFMDVEVVGLHPRQDEGGSDEAPGEEQRHHEDDAVNGFITTVGGLLFGPHDVAVIGRKVA